MEELKCKKCGKRVWRTYNGLGECCSSELQEQSRYFAKREENRKNLYWALRSRVLSDAEMEEVERWDFYLVLEQDSPFREEDAKKEFMEAMLVQFKMREYQRRMEKTVDMKGA